MIIQPKAVFRLQQILWPDVSFYDKQALVIESSFTCPETYVVAGNQLGKDFVAAFIALAAFLICLSRGLSCRIVTTAVPKLPMVRQTTPRSLPNDRPFPTQPR
jgi:hypothetical protein